MTFFYGIIVIGGMIMTVSFRVSDNTKQKLMEYFSDKKRQKTPPYAVFQADEADTVVTLYESGKVVFQGTSADIDASIWKHTEQSLNPGIVLEEKEKKEKKEKVEAKEPNVYDATTIGSDEVGTGDYFGPIVVTAAYVTKEQIPFLESLGVKDSKKLDDLKILEIVPKLIEQIPYQTFILNNEEYNQKYQQDINMNKMKAILHNKALSIMIQKYPAIDYIVVDQFAKPDVYYRYLTGTSIVKGITFLTKGEDKCLSVACASLISRFVFLKEFDKLGEQIDQFLPKGASNEVDEIAVKIVQKYGFDILTKIAKVNFKNTEKIKQKIEDQKN